MIFINIWILAQIVSPIFCLVYTLALFTWRFKKRKTIVLAIIFSLTVTVVDFLCVMNLYSLVETYPFLDFVYRITNLFFMSVFAVFLIWRKTMQTEKIVFGMLSVYLGIYVVDTAAITIRTLFGTHTFEIIFELMLYPAMLLVLIRIRKPFLEVSRYMGKRMWMLCFVPVTLLVALFMQISIPTPLERAPSNIPVALILCGVTIAVYGIIFYLFKTISVQNLLEKNAIAFRMSISAMTHQDEIVIQNAKNTDLFRHDMRHIAQMMSACAENNDMDGIRMLIGNLDKNASQQTGAAPVKSVTGHRLLDSTLKHHIEIAKSSGIDIMINMEQMDNVQADKTELSVVLANALENAIHACEKIPEKEKRIIRVDGRRRGKQFFLEIANTCAEKATFDTVTGLPVSNEDGHGYGSQSIAFFTQKYGSALEYLQESEWFRLRILL